jgi:hypothetical protein
MYAYAVERLKLALGSGFEPGKSDVIGLVENQLRALGDIKVALDLPPEAGIAQVLAAIQRLKDVATAAEKGGWWSSLFKAK